jgi:hypothetical protein
MFEDDDPNDRPDVLEEQDQQFFAALTLLCLAVLGALAWGYLVLTRGFNGPAQ